MSYEAIARRYARAVFEIGKEAGSLAPLLRDLTDLAEMYTHSQELRDVLDSPLVPDEAREPLLKELASRMNISETATSVLRLLGRRRRVKVLPEIARQLSRFVDEENNTVRAAVTSAGPLSDAYLADLRGALEKATGKKVTISHSQDPSLIAGIVTQIGDQVIDGSVRARLAGFRDSLLRT